MNKGFQKSWTLILITMCMLFFLGLLGMLPFFEKHTYLFAALGELLLLLPTAVGYKLLGKERLFRTLKNGFPPVLVPILILIPFCAQTFIMLVTMPVHSFLYEVFGDVQSGVGRAGSFTEFAAQCFSICLLPAVAEELLCRGAVMDMMKPYGIAAAMVVSALSFTLLHFSAYSFMVIFMLGMLLAAVRVITGSIWACMIIHFSNNFISLLIDFIPQDYEVFSAVLSFAAFVLFPLLLLRLLKRTEKNIAVIKDTKTEKITFSPTMCICIAVFALTTIFDTMVQR